MKRGAGWEAGVAAQAPGRELPFGEFVALIAVMMALTALSIDVMLPALPRIAESFALGDANDRQAVVTSYLLGFAGGQLLYGPASDRFGRKPALMAGLALFFCGALAAAAASGFAFLLAARFAQGLGGAAPRVISLAIVRDLFQGRHMARVMSFAMMVFVLAPVFAPALGQGILLAGSWRWNFHLLAAIGAALALWSALRLPETRRAGGAGTGLAEAARLAVATPQTAGYAIAAGLVLGCLMSYIGSAQQVFVEVYGLGAAFPLAFGGVASVMALSSFVNARLVLRLGMRRLSHVALLSFIGVALALTLIAAGGTPPFVLFCVMIAAAFFFFGLIVANFNAIAMAPMGHVAGTASSVIGFLTTAIAALLGMVIGRLFDGSVLPLAAGFTALASAALVVVVLVEGPRGLFRGD